MANPSDRTGWTVLAGIVLVVLGAWLLLAPLFTAVLYPIMQVLGVLVRIAWPLVLIGIGILLIIRARGGGFNVNGKKLYRSRGHKMMAGVLGGFAEYLNVDVAIVRVAYVLLTLVTGVWLGVLLYIAAMIIVPEQDVYAGSNASPWGQQQWEGQQAANVAAPPPPAPPVPGPPQSAPTPPPPPAPAAPAAPAASAPEPPAAPSAPEPPAAPAPPAPEPPVAPEPPATPTETP
jgi:phage shock protein PspC (stress-responsive transcriptional regulator)